MRCPFAEDGRHVLAHTILTSDYCSACFAEGDELDDEEGDE